jgi:hypothetical protein
MKNILTKLEEKISPMAAIAKTRKLYYDDMRKSVNMWITVMYFANGHQVVAGYFHSAPAQEEDMCRQFPLYHSSMSKEQHTLYLFGATITSCGVAKGFRKEFLAR